MIWLVCIELVTTVHIDQNGNLGTSGLTTVIPVYEGSFEVGNQPVFGYTEQPDKGFELRFLDAFFPKTAVAVWGYIESFSVDEKHPFKSSVKLYLARNCHLLRPHDLDDGALYFRLPCPTSLLG